MQVSKVNISEERRIQSEFLKFFELKKKGPGKWEFFPENMKFFSVRIENFLDRIDDPQDLKTDWRRCNRGDHLLNAAAEWLSNRNGCECEV